MEQARELKLRYALAKAEANKRKIDNIVDDINKDNNLTNINKEFVLLSSIFSDLLDTSDTYKSCIEHIREELEHGGINDGKTN